MNIQDLKTNLDWALYYRSIGWSPIPVKLRDKTALVPWKQYQTEIASEEQIREWWTKYPDANIGIVTGKVSGIAVVDIEKGGDTKGLLPTVMANTGGGGFHFFYKYPNAGIQNAVRIREKTDIRGDRGYAVVAPSVHKSGKRYSWAVAPEEATLAEFPQWILKQATDHHKEKTDWNAFLGTQNLEGTRHQQATMLVGKLLHEISSDMWDAVGLPALHAWNGSKNIPPLPDKELMTIWEDIKKAEFERRVRDEESPSRRTPNNQAVRLINLIKKQEKIVFFHNDLKEPFVQIMVGGHIEILSCKDRMLKRWLARIFWNAYKDVLNNESLKTAINIIESEACFDADQHILYNRVAEHDGAIWYDLADPAWRAVKITPDGWNVVTDVPILFRRYPHQQAQIEPTQGGDVKEFLKLVNIQDEDHKIVLLVWIVSCFIPDFPHPIPNFYGAQGSAKSFLSKFLRKLIDPSRIEAMSFPKDTNELAQVLFHHHCVFFDNVSHLPDQVSDALCKAVTGDGLSRRTLYTDEEDTIFSFQRCLGINGINIAAKNPDLLERSILFELQRVPPSQRRQEGELLECFENERPRIMGSIFDAVAKAMRIKPSVKINNLPRMADFTVWGCAIAEALGYTQGQFLDAYYRNIKHQNAEVLYDSPLACAVLGFMETVNIWEGTPTELLQELTNVAQGQNIDLAQEKDFPKKANVLTRMLNKLKTNLANEGIEFKNSAEQRGRRAYLRKITEDAASIQEPLKEHENDDNGILPLL